MIDYSVSFLLGKKKGEKIWETKKPHNLNSHLFFFFFLDWAFFLLLFFIGFTYDSMGKEKNVSSIKYTWKS